MKVAFTIGSIDRGGTETLLLDTFRQWQSVPFEMMLVHRSGGGLKDELYAAGPNCFELAPRRGRYISYLWQLRKLFQQKHVDVIHAQLWLDAIYAKLATFGLHIPIMLTFHGYFFEKGLIGLLLRYTIRIVDKICFVSKSEKQSYIQHYGYIIKQKGCVIYNGIDFSKLDNISNISPLSTLSSSRPKFCMVGSFNEVRSQMVICRALALLHEQIDFYFIGRKIDGYSQYDECVSYCQEHRLDTVHFLGGRDDVPALLQQMDGFVYSSIRDTFGIALIEAMAMGIPVIINDWEVLTEVAGDKARYFQSNNAEDCARAITDLLENLQEAKHHAKQTAEEIKKKYSIRTYINRLAEIYRL